MAASTFAQVQNIRLSGDIRLRGFYLSTAGSDAAGNQSDGASQFIVQRTRVCVEADLADHVLAVVTLKAEGNWGQASSDIAGRTWGVGVQEAYVQLRELFYTPATLKAGRQFLNYGDGLILSSANQNYTFDAGRLVLDYHPLVIDLVAGQVCNPQPVSPTQVLGQSDLLFVNAKYEASGSVIKDVEAYFGWMPQDAGGANPFISTLDPKASASSPMIFGLRTDLAPMEGLTASLEGVYEFGNNGGNGSALSGQISAWLAKAAVKYSPKGVSLSPSFNAAYTFAGGGGANGRNSFVPWFDDVDGYNGYLFAPQLSNIHIFNLGASIKPCANTTLALEGYYYLKVDKKVAVYSNPNYDFGGPAFANQANLVATGGAQLAGPREVGWELDAILGYDYSNDVRCQLVYAAFIPENVFGNNDGTAGGAANRVANEIRGEINVKF